MASFDKELVRKFWDSRVEKLDKTSNKVSITNLETNSQLSEQKVKLESRVLETVFKGSYNTNLLDLGCGYGYWSIHFSKYFKKIIAVEYNQNLIQYGQEIAKENNLRNITFLQSDVCDFNFDNDYDVVLISGLFLYLEDGDIIRILTKLSKCLKPGARIILRDGMSLLKDDHIISNKYSTALGDNYSAIYRTPQKYRELFSCLNATLIHDMDMFDDASGLNKWKETRLRVMVYEVQ
ncbi:class I SAM-dependent methyltransferase [Vibrio marisflavi]|uniref:2-methoxy-6-polyprenyl-1,4-benzoquinol methylase, mitochondrial n=1 Tax=Vibrio marisflavi CECT 7928 TaxID=634439 RepID=A0ABM9A822_9VIBR|nr:class I SAM-dependent methyltransferase [Vibrio marisflavi]CAH0541763.1 2-methoxy-6-polyprenyl-1,4-benzoquinol methylase, mitochondrial [Vibrio marisflavi CECT 7928]